MTQTEIEKLTAIADTLGVEVYHTDAEGRNYSKSDGCRVDEYWIPKNRDRIIIMHGSYGSLQRWKSVVLQRFLDKENKEVNHGS